MRLQMLRGMTSWRSRVMVAAVAGALMMFAPAFVESAWASTTITFATPVISGSSPDGPALGTQYQSQGLVFGPDTSSLSHPITMSGCGAESAVLYRDATDAYPPSDQVLYSWAECDELLQQTAQFIAGLGTPAQFVSLDVGMPGGGPPGDPTGFGISDYPSGGTALMTAYDSSGDVVGTDHVKVGAKVATQLAVTTSTADISYFTVEGAVGDNINSGPIEAGNLSFGTGSSNIPPAILLTPHSGTTFLYPSKSSGSTATEDFTLTRENGSTGAVNFTVSGLPAGVAAQITPTQSSASGNVSGSIKLTAPAGTLGSGAHTLTLTATPLDATTAGSAVSGTFTVQVENPYTSSAIGISLAQAAGDPAQTGPSGSSIPYNGVPLVQGRTTLVRVFADPVGLLINGSSGLTAELTGTGPNGQALSGGPLFPVQANPADLSDETFTTQLGQADTSFDFILPSSWSKSSPITLKAEVSAPQELVTPPAQKSVCSSCSSPLTLSVSKISFTTVPPLVITPVELTWKNSKGVVQSPLSLGQALRFALETAPISAVSLPADGYGSNQIDLSSLVSDGAGSDAADYGAGGLLQQWASQQYTNDGNKDELGSLVMGFNESLARGVTYATYDLGNNTYEPVAVVDTDRVLTSVAHEMNHELGRLHADQICGGPAGGGSDPDWPDQSGYIEPTSNIVNGPSTASQTSAVGSSYGVDLSDAAGGINKVSSQPFTIYPDSDTYDFMSYCAGAQDNNSPPTASNPEDAWISARGWAQALSCTESSPASDCPPTQFNGNAADTGARAASSAGPSILFLDAIKPGGGALQPSLLALPSEGGGGAPTSSNYTAQLMGQHGLISKTTLSASMIHLEMGPHNAAVPLLSLEGFMPTDGKAVEGVVLKAAGKQLLRIKAPRHRPRVTVRAVRFRRGAHSVTVRWSSHDRDHGTRTAFIAFAPRRRGRFQTVWEGGDIGKATLPLSAFDGARTGRLKVTVSNGFVSSSKTVKVRKIPKLVIKAFTGPKPGWERALEAEGIRVIFRR